MNVIQKSRDGVSQRTVFNDLGDAGEDKSSPDAKLATKVVGLDGKQYPATQREQIRSAANQRRLGVALAGIHGYCLGLDDFVSSDPTRQDGTLAGSRTPEIRAA